MAEADEHADDSEPLAREGEHIAPEFQKAAYHCPHCGVLAPQEWAQMRHASRGIFRPNTTMMVDQVPAPAWIVRCRNCREDQFWVKFGDTVRLVKPAVGGGPRPHVDMPQDVRADYEEARSIVGASPRAACALSRLAVQKLVDDLVESNANLNDKIGTLVEQGLPVPVQQALDALRVVGNNAVHPGELDLRDDVDTAIALFECMNMIVEDRVAQPNRIAQLYDKLPASARAAIQRRDRDPGSTS